MRRTVRALSVAALASVVLGFAASAAFADPAAEVGPSSVSPGGSVTVSVSCDTMGVSAPAAIDATSQAFEQGTVKLQQVPGGDSQVPGADSEVAALAYRGTARISPATGPDGDPNAVGRDSAWTVDGSCPAASGGQGKQWSATFDVPKEGGKQCAEAAPGPCDPGKQCAETATHPCETGEPCPEPSGESCDATVIQRGVRAGEGGSLTGSVPALVAGGLLITGGLGAAAHRIRHRNSDPTG
ncbi:hypothetical protein OG985_11845 [Streptomyces sp. NBC_00289]|uniref:hypothetical protein n=1 Tax=Streptomyces sp. NBC_00289 TaxID=2975703 RepID=UPI00324694AF